jgi:hypothetical protein
MVLPWVARAGNFGGRFSAVGGISIDASGVVRTASLADRHALLEELRQRVAEPAGQLADAAELRMVSLRGLQAAIQAATEQGKPLPDEVRFLAGLQRIRYVFVYPERNDIVLAGPAEPWVIRDDATVVGKLSGRPVLLLDDLVVALQAAFSPEHQGMQCSIEPTAEGYQQVNQLLGEFARRNPGADPRQLDVALREAFGPQQVKLAGIPQDSHFARVMVAADYQMKRYAMDLEPAPIDSLPSYLDMASGPEGVSGSNPRWWMACNYDALQRSENRLAWQISGQGVKTLTETDLIDAAGNVQRTGKSEPTARRWAETMTKQFDALSERAAIFGELRNAMDLALVAALIHDERLADIAGCNLQPIVGDQGQTVSASAYTPVSFEVPKAVEPQCSFLKKRKGWMVTASGGVEINPYAVLQQQTVSTELDQVRSRGMANPADQWWWNG